MTASSNIWHGIRLTIEGRVCSCGGNVLRVHTAGDRLELHCEACDVRRGLLSDKSADFVLAICRGYGTPTKPITLRRPQANSARAEN
jgi:hypothetical protein